MNIFPVILQGAAASAIAHKESLVRGVLLRLGLIVEDVPYDMDMISRRCQFKVYRCGDSEFPDGTEIFEVDGVPELAIYPHTSRLDKVDDHYVLRIEQSHRFL